MLASIRDDEQGVAMVVAVMVVFVVLLLATVVFSQAVHDTTASGNDRKRLQSVDAAEAGLDYFFNYLEQTPPARPVGSCIGFGTVQRRHLRRQPSRVTQPIGVSGGAGTPAFTITPTCYDGAGTFFSGGLLRRIVPGLCPAHLGRHDERDDVEEDGDVSGNHTDVRRCRGRGRDEDDVQPANSFTVNGNSVNDEDIDVLIGNASSTSGLETIKGNVDVERDRRTSRASPALRGDVGGGA